MAGMFCYPKAAMERAMKVLEVILRAIAKKITWYQAAEMIGKRGVHRKRRPRRTARLKPCPFQGHFFPVYEIAIQWALLWTFPQ